MTSDEASEAARDEAPEDESVNAAESEAPQSDVAQQPAQRWGKPATWSTKRRLVALGVLAALVAGVVLVVELRGTEPAPRAGEIIADPFPLSSDDTYADLEIKLPSGRVFARINEPVAKAEPYGNDEAEPLAVEGHALLPLEIDYVSLSGDFEPLAADATITLVVDGERFELGKVLETGPRQPTQTGYLVVPGSADSLSLDDVVLEVEFDGQTQTVNAGTRERESGVAEPLYSGPAALSFVDPGGDCGSTPTGAGATVVAQCYVDSVTVAPYDAELGWSQEGAAWITVTWVTYLVVRPSDDLDGAPVYDIGSVSMAPTLNAVTPVESAVRLSYSGRLEQSATFAVPVPAGAVTLATTGTLTGTVRDPEDPESQALPAELSATWSSELVFEVSS